MRELFSGFFVWLSRFGQIFFDLGKFFTNILSLLASFFLKHIWFFVGAIFSAISVSVYFTIKIIKALISARSDLEAVMVHARDTTSSISTSTSDSSFIAFLNFAVPVDQVFLIVVLLFSLWQAILIYRIIKSFLPSISS